jgi:hypothetical protein
MFIAFVKIPDMKLLSVALVGAFLLSCNTRKNVVISPDFETRVLRHQTIAILPVSLLQTNSKLNQATEDYGYAFQQQLQSHLLSYAGKNQQGKAIAFQPIEKTNAFLRQNNLSIEQAYQHKPDDLAKMFGVDAVLMVTLKDEGNFTQGPAAGLSGGRSIYRSGEVNPNTLALEIDREHINMSAGLYDGIDGKLIWRTYRGGGTDLPSNIDALAQFYSNWIAKRLPYKLDTR